MDTVYRKQLAVSCELYIYIGEIVTEAISEQQQGPGARAIYETAREYIDVYAQVVHGVKPKAHHRLWLEEIVPLILGKTLHKSLLIIAPPGHGKSTYVSQVTPTWYLGHFPEKSLLFLTSSDVMAVQFHTTVRLTLESERHHSVFTDRRCEPDIKRGWSADGLYLLGTPVTGKDYAYRSVGYGASVIGARAHGIILDDPLTQQKATSEIEQEKAKAYYDMTLGSRLVPEGWTLAIMTRWHERDLASHLMAKPGWKTITMPAISLEGKALWPEYFTIEFLREKLRDIGTPLFNALYQGDPSSLGGSVFRESSWFKPLPADLYVEDKSTHDAPIDRLRVVQFWDLAFSERDLSDYTAGATMGLDSRGRSFLLDMVRGRYSPTETLEAMVGAAGRWSPAAVGVELSAFRQRAVNDLLGRFRQRVMTPAAPVRLLGAKTSRDDVTRALLPAGRAEAGMLYVDQDAPWYPEFLKECLSFPRGAYDDQVDALAGAMQMLSAAVTRTPVREIRYIGPGGEHSLPRSKAALMRRERRAADARARLLALGIDE